MVKERSFIVIINIRGCRDIGRYSIKRKFILKLTALAAALLMLLAVLTACGGDKNAGFEPGGTHVTDEQDKSDGNIVFEGVERKIVYRVHLDIYAEDAAGLGEIIKVQTAEKGGYIESSRENNGTGYVTYVFVARIPTSELDGFLAAVETGGKVTNKTVSTTDITTQYVSAQARTEALEAEREALGNLLANAATTADVIAISERISKINAELGALEKELNEYDSLVDYSTVTVSITQETPPAADERSFGEKLGDLFVNSFKSLGTVFKGILIGITAAFPYLLILAGIAAVITGVILIARKVKYGSCFPRKNRRSEVGSATEPDDESGEEKKDGEV